MKLLSTIVFALVVAGLMAMTIFAWFSFYWQAALV